MRCYARAKEILNQHADKVHLIAQTLLNKETLDKDDIIHLIEKGFLEEAPEGGSAAPAVENADLKINIQKQPEENAPIKPVLDDREPHKE
ncbi:ATP-dependent zinc metalloprotease FtsH [compost metagenome]